MLKQRWARTVSDIMDLYCQLDADVRSFAAQSGLSCPPGCGACCQSPHVEATVAEMLPLALFLLEQGEWEVVLQRLQTGSSLCSQYEAISGQADKGRCRNYAQRPMLCRLFGYMGSRDKEGQIRYKACRILQSKDMDRIQKIDNDVQEARLAIPLLGLAHERVAEIGDGLGTDMLPINQALLRAIEMIGLSLQLEDHELQIST